MESRRMAQSSPMVLLELSPSSSTLTSSSFGVGVGLMWPDPLSSVTRTRAVPGRTSRGTDTRPQLISHGSLR
ncbi:hypothetical protein EYF80_001865 [Liparis tanakae]|uniref:Uncharacterized protein n=1 Tax=Liparis tanakae TaxID=230148 RepID=A0A4Z2JD14_9TELE|nr:hypothetical protein EYF80_001865 [Liparis tanakae]